jgi:hypothetical protein
MSVRLANCEDFSFAYVGDVSYWSFKAVVLLLVIELQGDLVYATDPIFRFAKHDGQKNSSPILSCSKVFSLVSNTPLHATHRVLAINII